MREAKGCIENYDYGSGLKTGQGNGQQASLSNTTGNTQPSPGLPELH